MSSVSFNLNRNSTQLNSVSNEADEKLKTKESKIKNFGSKISNIFKRSTAPSPTPIMPKETQTKEIQRQRSASFDHDNRIKKELKPSTSTKSIETQAVPTLKPRAGSVVIENNISKTPKPSAEKQKETLEPTRLRSNSMGNNNKINQEQIAQQPSGSVIADHNSGQQPKMAAKELVTFLQTRRLHQVAFQKSVPAELHDKISGEKEQEIHNKFDGDHRRYAQHMRSELGKQFVNSRDELKNNTDLNNLVLLRDIKKEISVIQEKGGIDQAVRNIRERINSLADPNSKDVVHVNNSSGNFSTFTIGGGTKNHYVSYEFRKVNDDYLFVMHNRGEGCDNKKFHGEIVTENGVKYAKTSVEIEMTKEQMGNEAFIKSLLEQTENASVTMDTVYNMIDIYITTKCTPPGMIKADDISNGNNRLSLLSEIETLHDDINNADALITMFGPASSQHQEMIEQKAANQTKLEAKLKELSQNPEFEANVHSLQQSGTCSEANQSGPEKLICPDSNLRREMKLFEINYLVNSLGKETIEKEFGEMTTYLEYRQNALKEKISKQ